MELKNTNPKLPISIVIPTLNEEKYLPRLLESLTSQEYGPEEIIVADADSTDRTQEIAKSYGARVVKGGMISFGRNSGAKAAKCPIVYFLDSDVVLPKKTLLLEVYAQFVGKKLDGCSCRVVGDEESKTMLEKLSFSYINVMRSLSNISNMKFGEYGWNMMFRKEAFDAIGGFNENITHFEDTDIIMRLVKHKNKYKYKILPLKIQTSGRRYRSWKKLGRAMSVGVLVVPAFLAGFLLRPKAKEKVLNNAGKMYGGVGGSAFEGKDSEEKGAKSKKSDK